MQNLHFPQGPPNQPHGFKGLQPFVSESISGDEVLVTQKSNLVTMVKCLEDVNLLASFFKRHQLSLAWWLQSQNLGGTGRQVDL